MAHTYIRNSIIRHSLELLDKSVVRHSVATVFTSEGFIEYHFKTKPANVYVIPNRLAPKILSLPEIEKSAEAHPVKIGFVGRPRAHAVINFAGTLAKNFPQYEFHLFGGPVPPEFETLRAYDNCFLHGSFKSPEDLPAIYSSIDVVLSTYDTEFANVRYAEPNKLYEAIWFRTPIIVSSNTYLSEKVSSLGMGWSVDATSAEAISEFLAELSVDKVDMVRKRMQNIPKESALNRNDDFFAWLQERLEFNK